MHLILINLLLFISGCMIGGLISWLIMKERASKYKESTDRQINQFEKEASLMKDNISSKEQQINTLTASLFEKDTDNRNLREKINEQKEDLEKLNERFKTDFKNLMKEVLNEKRVGQTNE